MTPVLMKVGLWDPSKYEAELQYEDLGMVSYVKSCLVQELVKQIREKRYVVRPLGDIIRRSSLMQDRKDELEEVTNLYKKYKARSQEMTDAMLGELFFEIIGCEGLFDVIPTEGLYSGETMDELVKKLADDEEGQMKLYDEIMEASQKWLYRMENAMEKYISVEPEEKRCALTYMLAVKGEGGRNVSNIFSQLYNVITIYLD